MKIKFMILIIIIFCNSCFSNGEKKGNKSTIIDANRISKNEEYEKTINLELKIRMDKTRFSLSENPVIKMEFINNTDNVITMHSEIINKRMLGFGTIYFIDNQSNEYCTVSNSDVYGYNEHKIKPKETLTFEITICNIKLKQGMYNMYIEYNYSIYSGYPKTVKSNVLETEVYFSKEEMLIDAVENLDIPIVSKLIDEGVDLNISTLQYPLFFFAISSDCESLIKLFLDNHIDINVRSDTDNGTALHWAVFKGNLNTVKYLVENGADINAETNRGETVIFSAVSSGNKELIKYLIKKGININKKNTYGKTAKDYDNGHLIDDILKEIEKENKNK